MNEKLQPHDAYLEKVSEFAGLLRAEGIAAGLQETADACTILESTDFSSRENVHAALSAIFAKSQQEQAVFDRLFGAFFVSIEQKRALMQKQLAEQQELAKQRAQAEEDLRYRGEPMDIREDLKDVYAQMPESERERLRQLMDKYKASIDRSPELYGNFIHSVFMRALMEQQMAMEDAGVGCEQFDDPELELLYRDIARFQDAEIPRAIALISKITQQINGELTARRQSGGHSGKLDFKRTIRKGLETGGSFYRLRFKKRHKRRHRLVLLCDVSGSMLQFSEFALHFIQSMSEVSDSSRTFLFSEGLFEVDPFALQTMDSFRGYVKSSGLYGRGTDLGAALEQLLSLRPAALGPATTLLILSDTKTVNVTRAEQAMVQVCQQAGKIVWLNPIPARKWPYLHSVQRFSVLSQMVPCSTLEELGRACRRLVRT